MTTLLLYALIVAAVLAFIGLYFGIGWACELLRDRYQARRKHVASTQPPRRIFDRTRPPAGDKAQREAAYDELRALPEPGKDYISDHNVWLPRTPSAAELDELRERWLAAQREPVRVLVPRLVPLAEDDAECDRNDFCAGCWDDSGHCDGAVETCCCTCTWPEDWDEEDENEEPDPFLSETPAQVLPAWVIEALNGHDGVDACVDSIVARRVSDA